MDSNEIRDREGFENLSRRAHEIAVEKGWWEDGGTRNVGEALALIHSEVSEALEAWRDTGKLSEMLYEYSDGISENHYRTEIAPGVPGFQRTVLGKPVGFPSEMADIVIRVMDFCEGNNIDLARALVEKMNYNATRLYRHGGKKA